LQAQINATLERPQLPDDVDRSSELPHPVSSETFGGGDFSSVVALLREDFDRIRDQLSSVRSQIASHDMSLSNLCNDVGASSRMLDTLQQSWGSLRHSHDSLASQVGSVENQVSANESNFILLRDGSEERSRSLERLQQKFDEQQARMSSAEPSEYDFRKLSLAVTSLESRVEAIQQFGPSVQEDIHARPDSDVDARTQASSSGSILGDSKEPRQTDEGSTQKLDISSLLEHLKKREEEHHKLITQHEKDVLAFVDALESNHKRITQIHKELKDDQASLHSQMHELSGKMEDIHHSQESLPGHEQR
jgi:chromosome segregation ATPase